MTALAGYLTNIYYLSGSSTAFTNLALSNPSGDKKTWTLTGVNTKQIWDPTQPLPVQTAPDGVTWSTVTTGFNVMYPIGTIVFASAVAGGSPAVRVSGNYWPYVFLGDAKEVDLTVQQSVLDATAFQNPPSPGKTFVASLEGAQIALKDWWVDWKWASYLANNAALVLLIYNGANANQRFGAYCIMKQDSIKYAIAALNTEDLSFDVTGQFCYVAQ